MTPTSIYLDNAATTKTAPEVVEAMLPYFTENYGNPSSIYELAGRSSTAIDKARASVAAMIGAKPEEIYFTAGGSESDNWALIATFDALSAKGKHIITSKIEHHAILHTCEYLEKVRGASVTYLDVDENGLVDPKAVEAAITPETILISVMTANNEIGTVEPVREIGRIAREHGVLFHTDAVQAAGAIPINVAEMQADLMSLSGHKIHGPKGIGALYIREGVRIDPLIHGGEQEMGMRAGTENVAGIVGMGKAMELATANLEERSRRIAGLRDRLILGIQERIDGVRLNGSRGTRLPNNCSLSFDGIEGEALLLRLDLAGIAASSGSACASGSVDPSHVLMAIGLTPEEAKGSLRLTLGDETTGEEIDETVVKVAEIVEDLRSM